MAELREMADGERDASGLVDADGVDARVGRADDGEGDAVGDQLVEDRAVAAELQHRDPGDAPLDQRLDRAASRSGWPSVFETVVV